MGREDPIEFYIKLVRGLVKIIIRFIFYWEDY